RGGPSDVGGWVPRVPNSRLLLLEPTSGAGTAPSTFACCRQGHPCRHRASSRCLRGRSASRNVRGYQVKRWHGYVVTASRLGWHVGDSPEPRDLAQHVLEEGFGVLQDEPEVPEGLQADTSLQAFPALDHGEQNPQGQVVHPEVAPVA